MSGPHILITNCPTAFLHLGGSGLGLVDIPNNLRYLVMRADIYASGLSALNRYDIVLRYSEVSTGMLFVFEGKKTIKNVVLLPNLWWLSESSESEKTIAAGFFCLANSIVCKFESKSTSEHENLSHWLPVDSVKVILFYWRLDSTFKDPSDKELFKHAYKPVDYIWWLNIIIEKWKNQQMTIHTLNLSNIQVVFFCDYRNRSYFESCVDVVFVNFEFLPDLQVKPEMLQSATQTCKLPFMCRWRSQASRRLRRLKKMPKVHLECTWSNEHFSGLVDLADPRSTHSIREAVQAILEFPPTAMFHKNTRNRLFYPTAWSPCSARYNCELEI